MQSEKNQTNWKGDGSWQKLKIVVNGVGETTFIIMKKLQFSPRKIREELKKQNRIKITLKEGRSYYHHVVALPYVDKFILDSIIFE